MDNKSILTFKGRVKRDRTLAIRPNLSVKIINWPDVEHLVGERGFFNVIPTYHKKSIISVEIVKYLKCE